MGVWVMHRPKLMLPVGHLAGLPRQLCKFIIYMGKAPQKKSETRTFSHGPRRQSTQWFAVVDDSYTHSQSSALCNDSPEGAAVIYRANKRRERGLRLLEDIIPQLGDVSTSHRTNAAIKLHSRNCIHGCLLDVNDLPCHG
eukprot:COSAG05_NODE_221_length_13654_cov_29.450103_8_plen_140_part_00